MATVATQVNPVIWFEIPVKDMERARKFYQAVFGYDLSVSHMGKMSMAMFPMNQNTVGAAGSLVQAESYIPSHAGAILYFSVEDIEGTLRMVSGQGGRMLMPKTGIGEYGFIAHFEDTEGNRLALHSMK
jgi:predicted enzyme related to lactoylglutathione lyase